MKLRSFNSEIQHAVAQAMDAICNDIIIERTKYGLNGEEDRTNRFRVQSVYGDSSKIFKQLKNTGGQLTLPIVAFSIESINRDNDRVADVNKFLVDLPGNIFNKNYVTDTEFKEMFNRFCPTPINISFTLHILCKYHVDFDQIISNFVSVFNPSIYVVTLHPKIPRAQITHQIVWDGQINTNFSNDVDIKELVTYGAETTFEFRTWIFPGINNIKALERGIIKKVNWSPAELCINTELSGTFTLANFHAVDKNETFESYIERLKNGNIYFPQSFDWIPLSAIKLTDEKSIFGFTNKLAKFRFGGCAYDLSGLIFNQTGFTSIKNENAISEAICVSSNNNNEFNGLYKFDPFNERWQHESDEKIYFEKEVIWRLKHNEIISYTGLNGNSTSPHTPKKWKDSDNNEAIINVTFCGNY